MSAGCKNKTTVKLQMQIDPTKNGNQVFSIQEAYVPDGWVAFSEVYAEQKKYHPNDVFCPTHNTENPNKYHGRRHL
jgi:hypothetical protein